MAQGSFAFESATWQASRVTELQPPDSLHLAAVKGWLELLECLKSAIEDAGSVVAYHSRFESGVLERFAEAFPDHSDWIEKAIIRLAHVRFSALIS